MSRFVAFAPVGVVVNSPFEFEIEYIDGSRPYGAVTLTTHAEIQFPGVTKEDVLKTSPGYVYILSTDHGWYKIGKSIDVSERVKQISPKLPFTVEVEHVIKTNNYTVTERALHAAFESKRTNGEWFRLSDIDLKWLKSFNQIYWYTGRDDGF
jgi:hypothetical protein